MASIADLALGDRTTIESIWADLRGLRCIDGITYFGVGTNLSKIRDADQIGRAVSRPVPEIYTFADAAGDTTPNVYWEVEITRGLVSVLGILVGESRTLKSMGAELPRLNRALLEHKGQANAFLPISSVNAPDAIPSESSVPKYGQLSPVAIVDVVLKDGTLDPRVGNVIQALSTAPLPLKVNRHTAMDQVIVEWGDLEREPPEEILARRDKWFGEILGFEAIVEPRSGVDTQVFLNVTEQAKGLSGYDKSREIGAKAVAYVDVTDVWPTLDELTKMLKRGATAEGLPLRDVVLIVPARGQAVELRKISGPRGLATVVYVGDDNNLYLPTT